MPLEDFKNELREVARPNRFLVSFEGPILNQVRAPTRVQFFISKASIPSKDFSGPTVRYRGKSITLAGDYKKESISLTFWNDTLWRARTFIEDWLAYINNTNNNLRRDMESYRFGNNMIVDQLGSSETNILATYKYFDVVPLDVSNIELDQTQENSLADFTVSFHYSNVERI